MAISFKKTCRFYQSTTDGPPPSRTVQIAAGQGVWMPGAACFISEAGLAELVDATGSGTAAYHGFLLGTVTAAAAANTEFRMSVLRSTDIYAIYIENNGTDTAEAQAYVGNDYGVARDATAGSLGYLTMDVNDTANTAVTVVDIMSNVDPEKHNTTDAPGVALVQFKQSVIDLRQAAA